MKRRLRGFVIPGDVRWRTGSGKGFRLLPCDSSLSGSRASSRPQITRKGETPARSSSHGVHQGPAYHDLACKPAAPLLQFLSFLLSLPFLFSSLGRDCWWIVRTHGGRSSSSVSSRAICLVFFVFKLSRFVVFDSLQKTRIQISLFEQRRLSGFRVALLYVYPLRMVVQQAASRFELLICL